MQGDVSKNVKSVANRPAGCISWVTVELLDIDITLVIA